MKIVFCVNYTLETQDCTSKTLAALFTKLLPIIAADLYRQVLLAFAEFQMKRTHKSFSCKCGNNQDLNWKTRSGKDTVLKTLWGEISIPQLQVQCRHCNSRFFITRKLLNMLPRQKISDDITRKFALLGATTTFRSAQTVLKLFGSQIGKTTIWRSVQEVGSQLTFGLDPNEPAEGMADGTGIPIQGIKKRGRELKVFAQKKKSGGIRIAAVGIGKYESGWDEVFSPLKQQFEEMGKFHMTLDGDCAILRGFNADIDITVQRCLWHIPHQMKHNLWRDGIEHKSELWLDVMCSAVYLTSLPQELPEEDELIEKILEEKQEVYQDLIATLDLAGAEHCITFLENARQDMFTSLQKKLKGKTTSLIERLMRTVNLRINAGKWKPQSALNLLKVRLAHYYNGYDWQLYEAAQLQCSVSR